jgi:dTDP-4-amino-4,6-dideoxygalactose transaminase
MNAPAERFLEERSADAALIPVARSIEPDRELLMRYIDAMCTSRRFSNFGPIHEELRTRLQALLNADRLGLFSSATSALTIALRALGVSGEVITTPFSFAASAQVIEWAGATPVFVDIDPHLLTIDPNLVEAAITQRTSAILAVHIYGVPCDVSALEGIAKRHGLKLIFDAAHAFDTRINNIPIHRFGDATIYRTHASKLFHTGEGGVLVCRDANMQQRCERMSNFGFDGSGDALECGTNAKMSELHAATGLAVLPKVAFERAARASLRKQYESVLKPINGITIIAPPAHVKDSLQYFAIRAGGVNDSSGKYARNLIHDRLIKLGVGSRKYFYPLCTELSYLPYSAGHRATVLPIAQRAATEMLCLPFHSAVSDKTVATIASVGRGVMSQSE